jgi:hypothetical protein
VTDAADIEPPRRGPERPRPPDFGAQTSGLGKSLPEILDLVPRQEPRRPPMTGQEPDPVVRELASIRHDLRALEERLVSLMVELSRQNGPSSKKKKKQKKQKKQKKAERGAGALD